VLAQLDVLFEESIARWLNISGDRPVGWSRESLPALEAGRSRAV